MATTIKNHDLDIILHPAATAALAAPALASDGAHLKKWHTLSDVATSRLVEIAIDAAGAGSITAPYLCAYDDTAGKWRIIALLNGGNPIALTATLGWADTFSDIATYDRLALFGTLAGTTVTVTATLLTVLP